MLSYFTTTQLQKVSILSLLVQNKTTKLIKKQHIPPAKVAKSPNIAILIKQKYKYALIWTIIGLAVETVQSFVSANFPSKIKPY